MNARNTIICVTVGAAIAAGAGLATFAQAQTDSASDMAQISDAPSQAQGLDAWAKLHGVLSHPRCANCHVEDGVPRWSGPSYGAPRKHAMNVGGDPDLLFGNPGMMCMTCHMAENAPAPHGPPGAKVWHLPPAAMAWWNKSAAEICAQIKDPARNGGRSLSEIETHIADDALVAWGWAPGPGRAPAPYSAAQAAEFVAVWAAAGAPCPPEGE